MEWARGIEGLLIVSLGPRVVRDDEVLEDIIFDR
jgi:hypothetical protein